MSGIVAYYRVSTPRRGRSGLGLEAQRKAVASYAASHGLTIADEFTEIETGKGSDALDRRPVFANVVLGNQKQADANKAAAAARDADLRPILEAMRGQPLRAIAEELTDRGMKTPRGGDTWNQVTVMPALKRLGITGK
jgi:hypothetical protein